MGQQGQLPGHDNDGGAQGDGGVTLVAERLPGPVARLRSVGGQYEEDLLLGVATPSPPQEVRDGGHEVLCPRQTRPSRGWRRGDMFLKKSRHFANVTHYYVIRPEERYGPDEA